jgi:ABC-type sugar transport system permease subunit
VLVGLALVVPAAIGLLVSYVIPTVWTVRTSFMRVTPLSGEGRYVGLDNYDVLTREPGTGFGFALALGILPVLTIVVVCPLLAYAAHRSGRVGRWTVRLALVLPTVAFVPTAFALGAILDDRSRTLADPSSAPAAVAGVVWLTTFGLVCGIGVTVFLAALRRPAASGVGRRRSVWPAVLAVGGLAVLAIVAVAVQSFTYPWLMTRGGPMNATVTPMVRLFHFAFEQFEYGAGAANAVLIGVVLGVLGVATWLVILLTRMRIELDPVDRDTGHPVAMVAAGAVLLVVVSVTVFGLWPWLSRLGGPGPDGISAGSLVNTWLPPLVSTVVSVGLAAVAGFGIGALRPLGRFSELLLLPFAPWLFVGVGPLSVAHFENARDADRINTVIGLIPPSWLTVPALFVFAMLFRGLARGMSHPTAAGAVAGTPAIRLRPVLVPALPMLALVGGATWLVQAQSLLWPLLVATEPEEVPTTVATVLQFGQFATRTSEIGLGRPLPLAALAVFAVGLSVLQVLYLDRIAIRVGAE